MEGGKQLSRTFDDPERLASTRPSTFQRFRLCIAPGSLGGDVMLHAAVGTPTLERRLWNMATIRNDSGRRGPTRHSSFLIIT